jgi:hypothetical protein
MSAKLFFYLLFRFARRDHANNPIREATIPNPWAAEVAVVVTAGVAVAAGGNVAIGVRVGFAVGGAPIALRATPGSAAWLA